MFHFQAFGSNCKSVWETLLSGRRWRRFQPMLVNATGPDRKLHTGNEKQPQPANRA